MRTDYRTFVAALLAVWVLASAADAADIRPTIGSRVRVKALALGPGWHEGMFNRTRTEPACSIVVFFKPRPSRTDALEASSTIYVRDVTALEVYTGAPQPFQDWAVVAPETSPHLWQRVTPEALRKVSGVCGAATPRSLLPGSDQSIG
mgnify:CR=1 FL=1